MAIIQPKEYKDILLLVDRNQIGNRDRGVEPHTQNNARIDGTLIDFHPMVRDNWGTADPLRGVLGNYYTRYRGELGETLVNYSAFLERLRDGADPSEGAWDRNEDETERTGRLRRQLAGNNNNTNIIFNVDEFDESPAGGSIKIDASYSGWNSYSVEDDAGSNWFLVKFSKFIKGSAVPGDDLLIEGQDVAGGGGAVTMPWPGLLNDSNFIKKIRVDHTSQHYLFSSNRSIRQDSGLRTDIEPVYNFYISSNPDYEDVIADPRVEEYLIPNSYYLQLELQNTSSNYLALYHRNALTVEFMVPWFNFYTNTEANTDSYYNLYTDRISTQLSNQTFIDVTIPNMKKNNGDLAVLHSDLAVLNEDSILTETIPFYNKITIGYENEAVQAGPNSGSLSLLQSLISETDTKNYVDLLQAACVAIYYLNVLASNTALFATKEVTRLIPSPSNNNKDKSFASTDRQYPIFFDLEQLISNTSLANLDFIKFTQNNPQGLFADTPVRFLRDYFGKPNDELNIDPYDLSAEVNPAQLELYNNSSFTEEVTKFKRTLSQVYNGDPCHSETLLYIIEKYRVTSGGGADELVQTFFISPKFTPSAPSDTVYYDSQIKYNQKYRYDFKKVVLVFGNRYEFDGVQTFFGWGISRWAIADYTNDLSIKALLVPYSFEGLQVSVIDKPPVSPNLSFYPMKGVDTRVKVLLNSNTGDYMDKPVAILDSDRQFIEEEYFGQTGENKTYEEIRSSGSKIRYTSDDPVDKYQLFRINVEPTSYEDFNNNFVEIDPDVGTPGYFEDIIIPNRKYYYCARSVDIHGNISNPTYIFEIEMFNNEGQIYLRQQIFTFKAQKPTYIKEGRRFIYIEPSFQQVALDPNLIIQPPDNIDQIPADGLLGVAGDDDSKCWQQNFKIRVTSKKTGRKMDLNITFKNSGVTNPS